MCQLSFGLDKFWWLVPTHPELKTNYFEKVWPKREIRMQRKTEQYEKDTEDSDPDKKQFSIDQRKAQFEKKVLWILLITLLLSWVFYVQDYILQNLYSTDGHLLAAV